MDKKYVRSEKGRLVDANGVTGKKVIKKLREQGKQVKYQTKPEKKSMVSKKEIASKKQKQHQKGQQSVRAPDPQVPIRLIQEPVHFAQGAAQVPFRVGQGVLHAGQYMVDPLARAGDEQLRRALQLSKKQYDERIKKQVQQQLGQRNKMQQQDKISKQRQQKDKKDFVKENMKSIRSKKLAEKAKQQQQNVFF